MDKRIKPIIIDRKKSIEETIKVINDAPLNGAPSGVALVVDRENKLLGMVTDGDIRRAVLKKIDLSESVEKIMNSDPVFIKDEMSNEEKFKFISKSLKTSRIIHDGKINCIPVLDKSGKLLDLVSFFDLWKRIDTKSRNICILGLGYVGLTLGITFAVAGFDVYAVDTNENVINDLKKAKAPFYEEGLIPLLKKYLDKKLFVSTKINPDLSDVYIVCVGTPVDSSKKPRLDSIERVAKSVGGAIKKGDLIVLRSTVSVGITRDVVKPILEKESGLTAGEDFYLVFAPERTIEGKALKELRELPQVIGGINKESVNVASNLFREITPVIHNVDSLEAAEMVKLINNTFRDVSFAYANELALICDKLNLDTVRLINAANSGYPRDKVPLPSPGVGGYCLSKDPYIFLNTFEKTGLNPKIVKLAREINEHMPFYVVNKIKKYFEDTGKSVKDAKTFVVGFAFKGHPETSDMRDSPTIHLVNGLSSLTKQIYGYDPLITREEIEKLGVKFCDVDEGFKGADCVVIMNNHASYKNFDIYNLLSTMNKPALFFDSWQVFLPEDIRKVDGISYGGLGND